MTNPGGTPIDNQADAALGGQKISVRRLKLYVAGSTPNSARAEKNLSTALEDLAGEARNFEQEVIDVLLHSKRALLDGVIVTPTLIGLGAKDQLTVIGDLTDTAELKRLLRKLYDPGSG